MMVDTLNTTIRVATGVTVAVPFRFVRPSEHGTLVEDLQVGDLVFLRGDLWPVWSVEVGHYDKKHHHHPPAGTPVTFRLGRGKYWEPKVCTAAGERAAVGVYQRIEAAELRISPPVNTDGVAGFNPPYTERLPVTIEDSGTTVWLRMTPAQTARFAERVDTGGWGPSGFVVPYDLIVKLHGSGEQLRIVEGSLIVTRSSALPAITPSWTPDPDKPGQHNPEYDNGVLPIN